MRFSSVTNLIRKFVKIFKTSFSLQALIFVATLLALSNIYPFYADRPWSPKHILPSLSVAWIYAYVHAAILFVLSAFTFYLPFAVVSRSYGELTRSAYIVPLIVGFVNFILSIVVSIPLLYRGAKYFKVVSFMYPALIAASIASSLLQWYVTPLIMPLLIVVGVAGKKWRMYVGSERFVTLVAMALCFLLTSVARPLLDAFVSMSIALSTHCYPCTMIYLRGYHPKAFEYLTLALKGRIDALYLAFPTWGTLISFIVVGYVTGYVLRWYLNRLILVPIEEIRGRSS